VCGTKLTTVNGMGASKKEEALYSLDTMHEESDSGGADTVSIQGSHVELDGEGHGPKSLQWEGTCSEAEPKKFFTRVSIFDISLVDTRRQTFTVSLFWEVAWFLDSEEEANREKAIWSSEEQRDKIHFANIISYNNRQREPIQIKMPIEDRDETGRIIRKGGYKDSGRMMVVMREKLNSAVFTRKFKLRTFPFDAQYFDIIIRSDIPEKEVLLINNDHYPSKAQFHNFTILNEFDFEPRTIFISEAKLNLPQEIAFRMKGVRKPGFVILNVFIPIMLISGVGLVVFEVENTDDPNEDFEKRFQVNGNLLLTLVAYKFAIAPNLPAVQYLIVSDMVVLFYILFQIALIFATVGFDASDADEDATAFSFYGVYAFVTLFWLLIFFVKVFRLDYTWLERDRKMLANDGRRKRSQCLHHCRAVFQLFADVLLNPWIKRLLPRDPEELLKVFKQNPSGKPGKCEICDMVHETDQFDSSRRAFNWARQGSSKSLNSKS